MQPSVLSLAWPFRGLNALVPESCPLGGVPARRGFSGADFRAAGVLLSVCGDSGVIVAAQLQQEFR